ncbi:MAG TPA: S8 family serine peptidase, partial [Streptosporangiaceae bacterium]|nr:S8 family serine peptidase [Streptosporangiaceae bacterium]
MRAAAQFAGAALAAAGLCAVTAIPAYADAVRDQEMWVLDMVHAPSAWPVTQGQGVLVAVIDSGVSASVSDLAGSVTEGPDLSGVNTPQSNASWGVHGTWMASLIAGHGHGDGSSGIEGVAPQSRVLSIRVVTDRGDPNFGKYQRESNGQVQRALAKAITIAARRGADVISMSLGYAVASRPVRIALQNALHHGVVVVASSGNSGDTASALSSGQAPYSFPADYPGVLGVGAVTQAGSAASFSSNNLSVAVAAPGVKVPAQGRDGQYWLVSGTSPACALTAGVAALIKSRYPRLSPALVDQAITSTAQNPPPQGYDARVGFGTVDAAAALTAAATLSHDVSTGRGVKVATQFGGGPASVPPVPVAPRGTGRLILYAVLMVACLAIAAAAAVRLTRRAPAAAPAGEHGPENAPWPGNAQRLGDGAWEATGAWPGNRAWEGSGGAWEGDRPRPGNGAWESSGPRPGNGTWEASGGPRPGNGTWEASGPRRGNGTWEVSEPRPGNGGWEDDRPRQSNGAREGSGPQPGNRARDGSGPRPGNRARDGSGPRPGNRPREGSGPRPGNGAREGSGAWPGGEPWPARRGRQHAPSGHGPASQAPPPPPARSAPPGAPP